MIEVYSILNDVSGGVINSDKLNDELESSGFIINFNGITIKEDILSVHLDSFNDKASADLVITNHVAVSLDDYKLIKAEEIDVRTGELILMGHEFPAASGNIFSLSQNAQLNILGINESRNLLTYPVFYSKKDNTGGIDLIDATMVNNFYLNALITKKTYLDSGNTLIDQINLASDEAAVDLIIDLR